MWNNLEESGRGLILGNIPKFVAVEKHEKL
jgi:hypothetical protein